jgi:hypothetical protein
MPVHVSTYTSYDPNALMTGVWSCGADRMCVFLHLIAKMRDWFLGQ